MPCFGCTPWRNPAFAALSKAAAKSAAARLRASGVLRTYVHWHERRSVCRSCPLLTTVRGTAHCGKPLLGDMRQIVRTPIQGCGCPVEDKAKSQGEHCPLNEHNLPARREGNTCNCKWCRSPAARRPEALPVEAGARRV